MNEKDHKSVGKSPDGKKAKKSNKRGRPAGASTRRVERLSQRDRAEFEEWITYYVSRTVEVYLIDLRRWTAASKLGADLSTSGYGQPFNMSVGQVMAIMELQAALFLTGPTGHKARKMVVGRMRRLNKVEVLSQLTDLTQQGLRPVQVRSTMYNRSAEWSLDSELFEELHTVVEDYVAKYQRTQFTREEFERGLSVVRELSDETWRHLIAEGHATVDQAKRWAAEMLTRLSEKLPDMHIDRAVKLYEDQRPVVLLPVGREGVRRKRGRKPKGERP